VIIINTSAVLYIGNVFNVWNLGQEIFEKIEIFSHILGLVEPIIKDLSHCIQCFYSCGLHYKGKFLDVPFTEKHGDLLADWAYGGKIEVDKCEASKFQYSY